VLSSTGEQGEEGLYGTGAGVMVIPHDRWMTYKRQAGGWRGPQHYADPGGDTIVSSGKKPLRTITTKSGQPFDASQYPVVQDSTLTHTQKSPTDSGNTIIVQQASSGPSAAENQAAAAVSAVAASAQATTNLAAAAPQVAAEAVKASGRQQAAAIERGNQMVVAELREVRAELRRLQKGTVRAFRDARA
jgi:hypothetical protein